MPGSRTVTTASSTDERLRRIYAAVAAVPRGCVASYGEIARLAGLAGRARLVGRALADCPANLPWHRVLNAAGRISLPPSSAAGCEQARRLAREGVPVRNGRVAATFFRRGEALDELLWGPLSAPPRRPPRNRGVR